MTKGRNPVEKEREGEGGEIFKNLEIGFYRREESTSAYMSLQRYNLGLFRKEVPLRLEKFQIFYAPPKMTNWILAESILAHSGSKTDVLKSDYSAALY